MWPARLPAVTVPAGNKESVQAKNWILDWPVCEKKRKFCLFAMVGRPLRFVVAPFHRRDLWQIWQKDHSYGFTFCAALAFMNDQKEKWWGEETKSLSVFVCNVLNLSKRDPCFGLMLVLKMCTANSKSGFVWHWLYFGSIPVRISRNLISTRCVNNSVLNSVLFQFSFIVLFTYMFGSKKEKKSRPVGVSFIYRNFLSFWNLWVARCLRTVARKDLAPGMVKIVFLRPLADPGRFSCIALYVYVFQSANGLEHAVLYAYRTVAYLTTKNPNALEQS